LHLLIAAILAIALQSAHLTHSSKATPMKNAINTTPSLVNEQNAADVSALDVITLSDAEVSEISGGGGMVNLN
jgi:hypothetical protein